jgi:hypothetical protein
MKFKLLGVNHFSVTKRFVHNIYNKVGRDSSVSIATRYWLDCPGDRIPVEGEIFRTRPERPWGPPSVPYNGYRVHVPGVKQPGRGVNHPPPFSAEVKEKVELYLYPPSGPSWPVLGRTLLYFTLNFILRWNVLSVHRS